MLRDQRDEAARHDASSKYADEVRRQIREKEQLRIAERNAFFEEGIKLDEEARLRRQKLDDIKKKKLDALRSVRVCVRVCDVVTLVLVPPCIRHSLYNVYIRQRRTNSVHVRIAVESIG